MPSSKPILLNNVLYPSFLIKKNFLSQEACLKIIDENKVRSDAIEFRQQYYLITSNKETQQRKVTKGQRRFKSFDIKLCQDHDKSTLAEKISHKALEFIRGCNEKYWKFPILDTSRHVARINVMSPKHQYSPHNDIVGLETNSFSTDHKESFNITFIIQLSERKNITGGHFCLHDNNINLKYKFDTLDQGDMIIFPSFCWHSVTPVKEGTRYTLSGWLTGDHLCLQPWWPEWFKEGKMDDGINL